MIIFLRDNKYIISMQMKLTEMSNYFNNELCDIS